MTDQHERGDWIQTSSGVAFHPQDPRVEDVHLIDIAHSLSHQCRFAGHVPIFYSVADHSVRVADYVYTLAHGQPHRDRCLIALVGLLHDASEAYVQDIVRPIKHMPEMAGYRDLEDKVARVIFKKFDLDFWLLDHDWIKLADNTLCATEKRDLIPTSPKAWAPMPDPLPEVVVPRTSAKSKSLFLQRFEDYQRGIGRKDKDHE